MLVALDASHGGKDPGAVGKNGLKESHVNLAVSNKARDAFKKAGIDVLMLRPDDVFVAISKRVEIANRAKADYLVSVHCNAVKDRAAHGTETFRYDRKDIPLANSLQLNLIKQLARRDRGVKQGQFLIIRAAKMPAALVELAFISNIEEEKLLGDPKFQQLAAKAIVDGVMKVSN